MFSADPVAEAAEYALTRGLILADTKFEFGLLPTPNGKQLILIDEVLTPDSSRYWSATDHTPGKPQPSFDKQYLRDWLIREGLRNAEGVTLPADVVTETRRKYEEAKDRVMGFGAFTVVQRLRGGSATHGNPDLKMEETGLQTDQATDAVRNVAGQEKVGVHGKKGLQVDERTLQTDQVEDAIGDAAGEGKVGIHGKKGLQLNEGALQTDEVEDAIGGAAGESKVGIHGKKGLQVDEGTLQTDQVEDAITESAGR